MAGLADVLPKAQLVERFGSKLVLEEYGKPLLKIVAMKDPGSLHGLAANVWNRIVTKHWHKVDPQQLGPCFQMRDPKLHTAISKLLRIEVIRDIYYVKGWRRPKTNANLVVEMMVAHVYRNDLQLVDVTFINPGERIQPSARKSVLQSHKGLGLLPTLLANLQAKAEELGCEQLTLTAGTEAEMKLFEGHGFVIEDSAVGRLSRLTRVGYPMERDVIRRKSTQTPAIDC